MDPSFGTRLRLQRERRQIALSAIASDTKIKRSLLEGLERDDVSAWPQGIFRRAYVRAYARAIGLEPDAVVEEFARLYPDPVEVLPAGTVVWPGAGTDAGKTDFSRGLRRLVTSAMAAVPAFHQGDRASEAAITVAPPRVLTPPAIADPSPRAADEQQAGDTAPFAAEAAAPPAAAAAPEEPATPAAAPASPDPVRPEPTLAAVAELCTRFGQVSDERQLAPLLADAAELLDAAGLILWVWDGRASLLRPALAHGYSEAVLARLPGVPKDAANAVASAFCSADMRVVEGDAGTHGAVAAPLIAWSGCVGVLALELRGGGERLDQVRAVATILAAQLTTLVASAPLAEAVSA